MGFGADADDLAAVDVEAAFADQKSIDDGIEVAVVLDVVDMTVDVIVLPARRDGLEVRVIAAACAQLCAPFQRGWPISVTQIAAAMLRPLLLMRKQIAAYLIAADLSGIRRVDLV